MYIRIVNMLLNFFKHFAIKSPQFSKLRAIPSTHNVKISEFFFHQGFYVKTILVSLESQNLIFWQLQRQWLTISANLSDFQRQNFTKIKIQNFKDFENLYFVELKSLKNAWICCNFQSLPSKLSKYQF